MVRWAKDRIRRFTRRDDGSMTIEFVILFPVLMIIFVSFLGFSMAFVRQSMILNHVNQVARAYSVGFFEDEIAAEEEIIQYIHDISSMKDVPESTLGYGSAEVEDRLGYVTIRVQVPMLRLISYVGMPSVWRPFVGSNTSLAVGYPIEERR
jgi:Flp pilus assembly protein TadG